MAAAPGPGGVAAPTAKGLARETLGKARRRLKRMPKRWQKPAPSLVATPAESTSPDVVAALRRCVWTDRGELRLEGWSYLPGRDHQQIAVQVYATTGGMESAWVAQVVQREDFEVNAFSSTAEDLSRTAWSATFTWSGLAATLNALPRQARRQGRRIEFAVVVELEYGWERHRTPLTKRYQWGSAERISGRALDAKCWLAPTWRDDVGLVLLVRRAGVVAESVECSGQDISLYLRSIGATRPTSLSRLPDGASVAAIDPVKRLQTIRIPLSQVLGPDPCRIGWANARGIHPVLADNPVVRFQELTTTAVNVSADRRGGLRVSAVDRLVQVDAVHLATPSDPHLVLSGSLSGDWSSPVRLELRGSRDTMTTAAAVNSGKFTGSIPLLRDDRWGNSGLAPIPGEFRLWVVDSSGHEAIGLVSTSAIATLYRWEFPDQFNVRIENHPRGGLWLVINDSRRLREIGAYAAKQLRMTYLAPGDVGVEDAIYFESFAGKFCACNPKAIFDEIRRRDTGLRLYWGVKDLSVPVPAQAIAVTIRSAEWWRIRHQARYLVTNDWLHETFQHRPHQRVMQTWHGTAFKLLGLDRSKVRESSSFARSVQQESGRWDLLLAENAYSVELMRRAYDYSGQVIESGYPRNDILASDAGAAAREQLRTLLGIRPDQQVLLYAPTWRDDRTSIPNELDLAALAERLGDGFVIFARGHANTLRHNAALDLARVVDVTSYPEASDLFCASDLCMTDYSSVMFDYAVTGKPMLFFTPDYERYVNEQRGVYFELRDRAPGPMLNTLDEVRDAVVNSATIRQQWSERYDAWSQQFNAWDDGKASVRATDALLGF
jgi:CDP-glycerol glycerophosphotransferase